MTFRFFRSQKSLRHDPETYFRRGSIVAHPETAERYVVLNNAALASGWTGEEPDDFGLDPILAVHSDAYITFLRSAWDRRAEVPGEAVDEILGTHFSKPQMGRRPVGLLGEYGYFACDTSTAIREGTWEAVYWSAQSAIAAAGAALDDGVSYALSRPPGHHAFSDAAAGFCYLNNAAIAAEYLRTVTQGRVAIIDIDVHHGNGAQSIFYERADVLTTSIHCDPSDYYPYFSGYADEIGEGVGRGYNLNLPLPKGTTDEGMLAALEVALQTVREFSPTAIVIALGLDAAKGDPLGAFEITKNGFERIIKRIMDLAVPTALIQEGGYLCDVLPVNLEAVLVTAAEVRRT